MKASLSFVFLVGLGSLCAPAKEPDIKTIQAQAVKGDVLAEYELGRAYQLGDGVKPDFIKAAELYRKAAAQGNAKSMHNLGYIYLQGQGVKRDVPAAAVWFQKAAERGLAASQLELGHLYYFGDVDFTKDYVSAAKWLTLAAKHDDAPALSASAANALGVMNEHGLGMPVDGKQAVSWYTKAAEMGNARAQSNLGRVYQEGHLVKRDPVQSYMWLKLAANRRDLTATHLLPDYIRLKDFSPEQMAEGDRRLKAYLARHPAATAVPSVPAPAAASAESGHAAVTIESSPGH